MVSATYAEEGGCYQHRTEQRISAAGHCVSTTLASTVHGTLDSTRRSIMPNSDNCGVCDYKFEVGEKLIGVSGAVMVEGGPSMDLEPWLSVFCLDCWEHMH